MSSHKLKLLLLFLCFCSTFMYSQTTYYVDQQNGNNTNNGTSTATAYQTFDKAESKVVPGDIIEIIGEYKNTSYNANYSYSIEHDAHLWHAENTIRISGLNGASGNYITIKPYNSNTVLKGDGANIFRILNSSYLKIQDFNIEGEVDHIPLSTANALQFVYLLDNGSLQGTATNPTANDIRFRNEDETNDNDNTVEETDIYTDISNENVIRPSYIDTRGFYMSNSSNIIISNNTIHHIPGTGLRVAGCNYITVEDNEIYRTSARSYSGTHALVVTKTQPIGTSGYSIKIQRNKIHHNYNEQYSWAPDKTIITPRIDEGKGISLQRNNETNWISDSGRILVANNVCYWNGFSGVHTNDGYRIDFINNTCYLNSYTNTVTYAGVEQKGNNIGISAQSSDDIKMINNLSVIDTDWNGFALSAGSSSNVFVLDNMIYGYNGTVNEDNDIASIDNGSTTIADPLFVDPVAFDFNLQSNSSAINPVDNNYAPNEDFFGNARDSQPDWGAIEYIASLGIEGFSTNHINVYPNPFDDRITIKKQGIKVEEIEIYNVLGQQQSFNYQTSQKNIILELNRLARGIYILKIGTATKKIVKTVF